MYQEPLLTWSWGEDMPAQKNFTLQVSQKYILARPKTRVSFHIYSFLHSTMYFAMLPIAKQMC